MAKTNLKKKRHALIISCIAFILILLIAAFIWIFSVKIYKANFDVRFESYEPLMLYTDDFDGLQRTKYQFASDKGQILTGYMLQCRRRSARYSDNGSRLRRHAYKIINNQK